jgi:membrane associated rhomboid family serine protease
VILPIGHQDTSVRRLPWVTFSLMVSCLLAFLLMDTSALEAAPTPAERLEEAADYWRSHAYLEADARIRQHVAYDVMPNQRSQYLATLPDLAEPLRPGDAEGLARQQQELDRLTAVALGLAKPEGAELNPFERWGFIPAEPRARGLFTHMFMHAGWLHLIGNLFMLLLSGPAIEDRWGRGLFAGFYVLAGIFAALFHMGAEHGSTLPLVGASGAIAGVLGAFLVRLWKTKIRFAYFFMFGLRPYAGTFDAAAWVMLPLWFGNELLQATLWESMGLESGVAYWAHVGGFLFGIAAALAVRALKFEQRFINPSIEAQVTQFTAKPVLEEAMAARERGELGEALALLRSEWERQPDEDIGLALWDAAVACAEPETGAAAVQAAVRACAKRGDLEVALRHWSELTDLVPTARVEPATLLRFVPLLLEENQRDRAVLALRHAVDAEAARLTPGQAMRAVELARELDPPAALRAARSALASGELHEAKRERLESLVAELEAKGVEEPQPSQQDTAPEEPETVWDEDGVIRISRFARAKLVEARPSGLDSETLRVRLEDAREAGVQLDRIQAVSVAIVADQGPRPVLLIDLLANWNEQEAEALRGLRLRSDRFDPRQLLGIEAEPQQSFVSLVARLLEKSRGVPLPSADAALGRPFARYATLAEYQREVLEVAE